MPSSKIQSLLDDESLPSKKEVAKDKEKFEEDKKNVEEFLKTKEKNAANENTNSNIYQNAIEKNFEQMQDNKVNMNGPSYGSKGPSKGQGAIGPSNIKLTKVGFIRTLLENKKLYIR